jgi:DNA-binding transcriptional LysR family regulator
MLNNFDLSRADLNLLVLFETVMEERHVGRSAMRLNLTASAVSHGLRRLRTMLDDPLFLKTPRGVVPTDRATELAPAVSDILARVRGVLQTAGPFDAATSTRRFVIASPDSILSVTLPPLLALLAAEAPRIDIGLKQLLPRHGELSPELAWQDVLADLENRAVDLAIVPSDIFPRRFATHVLRQEDFVIAMRKGHPYARDRSLKGFCARQHLVVSHMGDARGFVDQLLAKRGLSRRVALTVPNFMFALTALADTDLIAALPRSLVEMHGRRHGIVSVEPPLPLVSSPLTLVTPHAAMLDAGIAWLVQRIMEATASR